MGAAYGYRGPMSDYVFTMYRADKFYGSDRQVLANISLSFLPGAKIGVLGPNGAGKSTLLRIMAGLEDPPAGSRSFAPGASVGMLAQEPEPTRAERARERRGRRTRPARPLQRRSGGVRRAGRRLRRAARRAGEGAGADRPRRRLEPGRDARPGDGRASPARRRPRRPTLSDGERRRVALCRLLLLPTCCSWTSRPTTSTPSRSPGSSGSWSRTRAPSSP